MSNYPTPIFIFSLPRSGSTLLQRLLAAHEQIATVSESHLLLPFLYTLKRDGVYSAYNHRFTVWAFEEFCRDLPDGIATYRAEIRELALRLYAKAAKEETAYFVDKAAAYHLIAPEIMQLFPEAKFIFLWRNPLAVAASLIDSWKNGQWNLYEHDVRLYEGLPQLIDAYTQHTNNVVALRYEDLLQQPEQEMARVFAYLQLPFDAEITETFAQVQLKGRTGDSVGMAKYKTLNQEPLQKWKQTLANPLRKAWSRRYLQQIGSAQLASIGYDLDELHQAIKDTPISTQHLFSDLLRMPYGVLYRYLEGPLLRHKWQRWRNGQRVYAHK
ncbi:MAG: sulfotransferase [Ardenticatenaceae bacterium]|nr:sulfotransferase [Ardenticatenaceae bacterium]